MDHTKLHREFKVSGLDSRHITLCNLEPMLRMWDSGNLSIAGESVLGKPLYRFQIGNGPLKIMIWSQMHGNESTTTRALFDFLNLLLSGSGLSVNFLSRFTFCCLPMVNPDGAEAYTRENANNIDLNRDASGLTQPESRMLREVFENFQPDYCYNLHDQRTIYAAGVTKMPAAISFLSPAFDESLNINSTRILAANVIAAMNDVLQQIVPWQVGRFDDAYNINCTGDTFQSLEVPTILFEAGHFAADYSRNDARRLIFTALLAGLEYLSENDIVHNRFTDYLNIPQNKPLFFDFVYRNVRINYDDSDLITNFAAQYMEVPANGEIQFLAEISEVGKLENFTGHSEFDAKGRRFSYDGKNFPEIGKPANFSLGDDIQVRNGRIIS